MRKNIQRALCDHEKERYLIHSSKFVYDEDKTELSDKAHYYFNTKDKITVLDKNAIKEVEKLRYYT